MAILSGCVRVTTRRTAVWRECVTCTDLAPLAPDETRCRACRPSTGVRRAERRS